jgi:hypothetical protein
LIAQRFSRHEDEMSVRDRRAMLQREQRSQRCRSGMAGEHICRDPLTRGSGSFNALIAAAQFRRAQGRTFAKDALGMSAHERVGMRAARPEFVILQCAERSRTHSAPATAAEIAAICLRQDRARSCGTSAPPRSASSFSASRRVVKFGAPSAAATLVASARDKSSTGCSGFFPARHDKPIARCVRFPGHVPDESTGLRRGR